MIDKIYYLTLDLKSNTKGVSRKIYNKCNEFKNNNILCDWINVDQHNKIIFLNGIDIYNYNNKNTLEDFFNNKIDDRIILFRHHEYNKTFQKIFSKKIIISEHNTIEISEWLNIYKSYNIKDWIYLIRTFEILKIIQKLYFYKIRSKKWYRAFSGFVSVTNEIKNFQLKNYYNKSTLCDVISNGVILRDHINQNRKLFDEYDDEILFVFFAGNDYNWHNFERFAYSIINKASFKYRINYYGFKKDKIIHSNIYYYDSYSNDDIIYIATKNAIGVGSMGLFLNNLYEACPLKVRDYWSMGLPVILGYKDTDVITNDGLKKFVLEVPNDNSEISFVKIKNFIDSLKGYTRQDILDEISKISMDQKIKQYMNFIRLLPK